ncbi:MAG TPA: sigma-70 family RNA polymerase sigma factor [Candidatus Paceibacterota bacterium]|nr:sigma-70 family RNA polymerase sigma factor [Candidatus Paceibacterota bacterium]
MERSDEELIAAYIAGEESAFAIVVERHLKGVYSFARRFAGREEDTEDIVQDIFLKAWKSIHRYDSEASRFKTWLMRIARNTTIDHLRKKKSLPMSYFDTEDGNVLLENLEDASPLPDEAFMRAQSDEAVRRALEELKPAQREVLLLHYMSGLTFEEIGLALKKPPNTVKSIHRRALVALRSLLHQES